MVPTFAPFSFHWYEGVAPPPTGVAVKVMLVVGVTTPEALDEIDTDAVTNGVAVVVAVNEVALHPAAVVTVTEKLPLVVTTIDCVVAPLLHK